MGLTDREREAIRLGSQALDQALISLGRPAVPENPDFRVIASGVGDVPAAVLEKPGVAPFRFIFWEDHLDVWVGPCSEVVEALFSDAGKDHGPQATIERLLRSAVTCERRRWSLEISLRIPGDEPWLRFKDVGRSRDAVLEPAYSPYVQYVHTDQEGRAWP